MENEEVWKADVEASIAMKDSRLKVLQMEKDEKIAKVRVRFPTIASLAVFNPDKSR